MTRLGYGAAGQMQPVSLTTLLERVSRLLGRLLESGQSHSLRVFRHIAQLGTFTAGVAGACTLVIFNFTGAAAADPAAGDYIGFDVILTSQWLD